MKKNLILIACIAFILGACNKDKDSTATGNTWTFKGNSYTAGAVTYTDGGSQSNLSASATGNTSTSSNGLVFAFNPPPTTSGQVTITDSGDPNTVLVAASNLTGSTVSVYLNEVTTTQATVTVSGGKVSVSFPGSIWLHNSSNFDDSAQLSIGTITQQ